MNFYTIYMNKHDESAIHPLIHFIVLTHIIVISTIFLTTLKTNIITTPKQELRN